jgi:hypothetical protein
MPECREGYGLLAIGYWLLVSNAGLHAGRLKSERSSP